jgi:hypothetical protein
MHGGLDILALQGKTPHPKHNPRGFKSPIPSFSAWADACKDKAVTGVGIVCTPRLWVLDIDGEEGWDALYRLGIFPLDVPTAVTVTARGAHFWFESQVDVTSRGAGPRFLPHVDLKASGYVAAPPSLHPSGAVYRWTDTSLVVGSFPYAAQAPAALMAFLEELSFQETTFAPSDYRLIARKDIGPLVSHLKGSTEEGSRNGTLNWCALRAGASGHSLQETMEALLPVAVSIGLTPRESRATIRSGWTAGKEQRPQ